MKERSVLIVDDVITAGTAIRESVDILAHAGAHIVGVAVSLDRQEKTNDTSEVSAIQVKSRSFVGDFNIFSASGEGVECSGGVDRPTASPCFFRGRRARQGEGAGGD